MAVILIAGASKGIGLAMAHQLRTEGHRVFGTSRQPQSADLLPLDVTDAESVRDCVERVQRAAGRIDVLINNAGYDLYAAAQDTSFADLHAQMNTNFYGAVRLMEAVLPLMQAQGSGRIISLSSIGGRVALPFNSAYSASKFALEGYSEALRYELLPQNIFVSLVEPGQVRTDTLEMSIRSVTTSPLSARVATRARDAGAQAELTPQQVAAAVARLVKSPHPPLRTLVGSQAHLVRWLARLPERLFEAFMLRQFVTPLM